MSLVTVVGCRTFSGIVSSVPLKQFVQVNAGMNASSVVLPLEISLVVCLF